MTKRACVIVVTHNSVNYIDGLASSIRKFIDFTKDTVVFVDNRSTDSTVKRLELAFKGANGVKIFQNSENVGFARANNLAMRKINAEFYLFLNHDTYIVNDIVSDILSYYPDTSSMDIAGPALVYPDFMFQSSAYTFSSPLKSILQELELKKVVHLLKRWPLAEKLLSGLAVIPVCRPYIKGLLKREGRAKGGRSMEPVDWVTGACMMISRRVFEATGGFDERIFMYGEDEELCFRARRMDFKADWVNAGPVVHFFGWNENRGDSKLSPAIYDSMAYVIEKNFRERPLRRFIMKRILDRRFRKTLGSGAAG